MADELKRKKALVDQGLTNHFEYTQIQRNQADLIGQAGSIESELGSTRSQVVEAKEQIERSKTQRVEQAVSELAETRTSLADIEEQLAAAQAILSRTTIRSPADGVIVSAVYSSPGAVVAPGEKAIEILPTSSNLIVEAKLSPHDIDSVHAGRSARLKLPLLTPASPQTLRQPSSTSRQTASWTRTPMSPTTGQSYGSLTTFLPRHGRTALPWHAGRGLHQHRRSNVLRISGEAHPGLVSPRAFVEQ